MSDPIIIDDARSNANQIILKRTAMKGAVGDTGANGLGFNQVRMEKIENPMLWLFKKNKIAETIYPNNEAADLSTLRATTKTYFDRYGVLKTAAVNELPESADGYEIEPAGTNLVLRSQEIQNASWTKGTDYTFTGNTVDITDPYGTNLATKVVAGETPSVDVISQNITSTAGKHSNSIFIYVPTQSGLTDFTVRFFNGGQSVDSATYTEFDKWFRVDGLIDATGPTDFSIQLLVNGIEKPISRTFYLFGAQCEKSPTLTSYIVSGAATGYRSADNVTCDAYNNAPNLSEPFSFAIDVFITPDARDSSSSMLCFDELGSTFASSCLVKESAGTCLFRYADATQTNDLRFAVINTGIQTVCITFDGSNLKAYVNGQELGEFIGVTAKPISDTSSKVFIGRAIGGASGQYDSPYSDLRVWDFALTPTEVAYISS